MAWKFPIRNTRQKSPIDIETANDNFHEFISEAGYLNEQNWSATDRPSAQVSPIPTTPVSEAACQIHHTYWTTRHRIGSPDIDNTYDGSGTWASADVEVDVHEYVPPYGPSGSVGLNVSSAPSVKNQISWQALKSLTGTTQSATMWIMCSFFMTQRDKGNRLEDEAYFDTGDIGGTAQFALRYNGSIIWETATGTAEPDNDPMASRELHGPRAIVLDAIIPVQAGEFRLELVGRCPETKNYTTVRAVHGDLWAIEFRR